MVLALIIMFGHPVAAFLFVIFGLSIIRSVIAKHASHAIDHKIVPVAMALWMLLGLAITWPVYGYLAVSDISKTLSLLGLVTLFVLPLVKAALMIALGILMQKVSQKSLSSSTYTLLGRTGLIALGNAVLGERLPLEQWLIVMFIFATAIVFYFKGHISTQTTATKNQWLLVIVIFALLGVIDYFVLIHTSWFTYLLASNLAVVGLFCLWKSPFKNLILWKNVVTHPLAFLVGASFLFYEFVKFYQMDTYNTVTLTAVVEASTIPVVMALSAKKWQEGGVVQQLMWGVPAAGLLIIFFMAF